MTTACLLKSGEYPNGLMEDICRIRAILKSVVEMVRSDNDVTDLKAAKGTIETLVEIAEEALGEIMLNFNAEVYDNDPKGEKKEG